MKKKTTKITTLSVFSILLLFTQLFSPIQPVQAEETNDVVDIILLQNVPEVDSEITDNTIALDALKIFEDGHFELVTKDLSWKSTNKNVASVDQDGEVTISGKPGRTFIKVSYGSFSDRIAVDFKPDRSKKKRGKPDFTAKLVKSKGSQYDIVSHAVDGMTLKEKIGQMLMPSFRNWEGENVTEMLPEIEALVKEYHLGGVILFRENVVTTEQTAELVSAYEETAEKYGLLLTIDQEGGIVTRLQSGTDMPGNMALGATRSEDLSNQVGQAIGEELQSLGINMNLAPVLDVNNNPDNPVIGVRSFGESPELVADLGIAYTEGLQSAGVAATAKHFPGHGDTAVDSHLGLPEVPHDLERLKEVELYPFQQAMKAGIDAVMTAHVTFPKIDNTKVISKKDGTEIALPATLSKKVLTDLMRKDMGFEGVIITDALNMDAIEDHFGPVDAAVRAVQAGADILLMPVGLEEVAGGLVDAVNNGDISMENIDDSVERILTLKIERGIIKSDVTTSLADKIANAKEVVGSEAHKQVEQAASEKSITLVKNEDNALPLSASSEDNVVVVGNSQIDKLYTEMKALHENTTLIRSSEPLSADQLERIENASAVVVGTYTYNVSGRSPSSQQMQLVNQLIEVSEDAPVIGVGIRNPYDIMAYPTIDAYLAQYGFNQSSFEATAKVITGQLNPTGQLPVTIPSYDSGVLYEFGHGLNY
ncbi:glycoside hydrolase family 3 protein [Radiobacillus kanasensis]|uniref:glycoside hydrolase family 3 protein n=1 Tax=Radiobacillus kanasensis TaxID=2844358 RepID=UPI001E2E2DBC|nr:glycoside hydrolase family 3 protein [Radiobacillus kanasensis]UFT98705.1 glycoside hydrolase family 3 protein [Radiobacillus kanasensis]